MDPQNLEPSSDEARVRAILLAERGWALVPEQITLPDGTVVSVDGIDRTAKVLVEIVGWRGKNTSTRDDKMVADAAKLSFLRGQLGGEHAAFLVCCGRPFAANFRVAPRPAAAPKWAARVIQELGVEVLEVALEPAQPTKSDP